jgi:hypothetical protein
LIYLGWKEQDPAVVYPPTVGASVGAAAAVIDCVSQWANKEEKEKVGGEAAAAAAARFNTNSNISVSTSYERPEYTMLVLCNYD